jgi:hypothetical protein
MVKGERTTPHIMIGCPVGVGRSYVLPLYLQHINKLDYPKKKIHIAFLFNYPKTTGDVAVPHSTINTQPTNNKDEIEKIRRILKTFKRKTRNQYFKISIVEFEGNYEDRHIQGRRALGRWMEYFAEIRNQWIGLRDAKDEYAYSVDSDVLIPKDSLKRLLNHKKDIISLLIANGPISDPHISPNKIDNFLLPFQVNGLYPHFVSRVHATGQMAFNVMMKYNSRVRGARNKYDEQNYRHINPAELHIKEILNYDPVYYFNNLKKSLIPGPWLVPTRYGDLVEVDMTGACYLIHRRVLDAGVEYGFHHQGEDPYFCCMAQDYGFRLYCDYTLTADHIMNEEIFKQYVMSRQLRVLGMLTPKSEVKPKKKLKIESSVPVVLEKVGEI